MKQKFLLFCFALVCSANIFAHDLEVNGIYYNILSNDEVEVTYRGNSYSAYSDEYSGPITIPEVVDGTTYNVVAIGERAFYNCSELTNITIPESITRIGEWAFASCSTLSSVIIPESITTIGSGAFANCSSLTDINIPNSVISIGMRAFMGCTNLQYTISNNVGYLGNTSNEYYALIEPVSYESIAYTIHDDTRIIAGEAFHGLGDRLTSITIPEKVFSIGECAFTECFLTDIIVLAFEPPVLQGQLISIDAPIFVPKESLNAYQSASGWKDLTIKAIQEPVEIYYNYLGDNSVEVVAGPSKYTGTISIPSTVKYNGIDCNVTAIGYSAFSYCPNLTAVTIPESVTSIGSFAFEGCSGLTSITIPESVTSIGGYVFHGCINLTTVTWNAKNCDNSSILFGDISSQITSFTFGNSVQHIPAYLCYEMSKLASITIPESVISIGSAAFYDCSSINKVNYTGDIASWCAIDFGNNPLHHGADFYLNDVKVTELIIPDGTITISDWLRGCTSLQSVTIPNNVTTISDYAFYGCSSLKEITIPNSVISIGGSAFSNCSSLTSITIPESVTSIDSEAFSHCSNLTSVIWNAKHCVDGSENYFYDCSKLTSFIFGNEVEYIPAELCDGCSNLTAITIPSSVTAIGSHAFLRCSSLTSITIPSTVTSIGDYAFLACSSVETITVETGNPNYHSAGNCLIETKTKRLLFGCKNSIIPTDGSVTIITDAAFGNCSDLTSITIPESVTSIDSEAFSYCSSLTKIIIPNSVTAIGVSAFRYCSNLTIVTIEEGVTAIGGGGFYGCSSLTSINIPKSVTTIGEYAFSLCSSLTNITFPDGITTIDGDMFVDCSSLIAFNIPTSVTTIGQNAFGHCSSLTEITIPENVTTIGNSAFSYCSNLTKITCLAVTPPVIEDINTFQEVDHTIPLYVPAESVNAYKAAEYWNEFTNIQAIPETVIPFTALNLRVDEIALYPGEKYFLNTVVEPTDMDKTTLVWTTSDENIATVDSTGFVTAHTIGTAQIIVSTPDNALSNTCEVLVLDESQEPSDDVVVDPDNQSAEITWTPVDGAAYYLFVVYADESQATKICTLTFNAWGFLTNIHFQRNKPAANREDTPFNFTVTGLEQNTTYGYSMSSYDEEDAVITNKVGQFTTTSNVTTSVETPYIASPDEVSKVLENGMIYIIRNGEKYTIDGRKVI